MEQFLENAFLPLNFRSFCNRIFCFVASLQGRKSEFTSLLRFGVFILCISEPFIIKKLKKPKIHKTFIRLCYNNTSCRGDRLRNKVMRSHPFLLLLTLVVAVVMNGSVHYSVRGEIKADVAVENRRRIAAKGAVSGNVGTGTTIFRQAVDAAPTLAVSPTLSHCRVGQRFIMNHILYICHQFTPTQRGFRPFGIILHEKRFFSDKNRKRKFNKIEIIFN